MQDLEFDEQRNKHTNLHPITLTILKVHPRLKKYPPTNGVRYDTLGITAQIIYCGGLFLKPRRLLCSQTPPGFPNTPKHTCFPPGGVGQIIYFGGLFLKPNG
jgi:hypothetical protein